MIHRSRMQSTISYLTKQEIPDDNFSLPVLCVQTLKWYMRIPRRRRREGSRWLLLRDNFRLFVTTNFTSNFSLLQLVRTATLVLTLECILLFSLTVKITFRGPFRPMFWPIHYSAPSLLRGGWARRRWARSRPRWRRPRDRSRGRWGWRWPAMGGMVHE